MLAGLACKTWFQPSTVYSNLTMYSNFGMHRQSEAPGTSSAIAWPQIMACHCDGWPCFQAGLQLVLQVELGMQRMSELMKICNKFMLRRTSTVLKELLPTKVEQVGPLQYGMHSACPCSMLHVLCTCIKVCLSPRMSATRIELFSLPWVWVRTLLQPGMQAQAHTPVSIKL